MTYIQHDSDMEQGLSFLLKPQITNISGFAYRSLDIFVIVRFYMLKTVSPKRDPRMNSIFTADGHYILGKETHRVCITIFLSKI